MAYREFTSLYPGHYSCVSCSAAPKREAWQIILSWLRATGLCAALCCPQGFYSLCNEGRSSLLHLCPLSVIVPWIKYKIGQQCLKGGRSSKAGTPELVWWVRRGVQGGAALPRQGVAISLVPDLDLGPRSVASPGMRTNRLLLIVWEYGTCFAYIWPKLLCSLWKFLRFIEPESKREHNSALMGRQGVDVCQPRAGYGVLHAEQHVGCQDWCFCNAQEQNTRFLNSLMLRAGLSSSEYHFQLQCLSFS